MNLPNPRPISEYDAWGVEDYKQDQYNQGYNKCLKEVAKMNEISSLFEV